MYSLSTARSYWKFIGTSLETTIEQVKSTSVEKVNQPKPIVVVEKAQIEKVAHAEYRVLLQTNNELESKMKIK